MTTNVVDIAAAKRRLYVGETDAEFEKYREFNRVVRREWQASFTRIGNALGLRGRFLLDFGYSQIEASALIAGLILGVPETLPPKPEEPA